MNEKINTYAINKIFIKIEKVKLDLERTKKNTCIRRAFDLSTKTNLFGNLIYYVCLILI